MQTMVAAEKGPFEPYVTYLSQLCIILGGVIPYIPQYQQISKSGDATGFSTLVCFSLILSSVLRIVYWFGHHFDEALLIQSVVMLIAMFCLLELCIRMNRLRSHTMGLALPEATFSDFNLSDFWQWTDFKSYVVATSVIALISSSIMVCFITNKVVVEAMGYVALLVESFLAVPQFLKNLRNRSVQGMNVLMVILWTVGDAFKGMFFIWKNQPLPFILNAAIQIIVDILIMIEIAVF